MLALYIVYSTQDYYNAFAFRAIQQTKIQSITDKHYHYSEFIYGSCFKYKYYVRCI